MSRNTHAPGPCGRLTRARFADARNVKDEWSDVRKRVREGLITVELMVVVVLLFLILRVLTGGAYGPSEGSKELMQADPEVLVTQV